MRDAAGKKIPSKKVQNRKEVRDFIMARAKALPPQWEDHKMCRIMKTEEILNTPGLLASLSEEMVEKLEPGKSYNVPYNMSRQVNHYERMMNLAKTGGAKAAAQYYDEVLKMIAEVIKGNQIGGINTEIDYGPAIRNF
jgi:hypothetical protein